MNSYQVIFTSYFLHLEPAFSRIPELEAILLERDAHVSTERQDDMQDAKGVEEVGFELSVQD